MGHESSSVDQLYLNAETLAQDFSLFPRRQSASVIGGLLNDKQIEARVKQLRGMEVDAYIAATVAPTEESTRPGAKDVVAALDVPVANVIERGPFYCAELSFDFNGTSRKVGLIAQNRAHGSGVWGPGTSRVGLKNGGSFCGSLDAYCHLYGYAGSGPLRISQLTKSGTLNLTADC